MGLYDHLRCEMPLPDGWDCKDVVFQTKDTEAQYLENYVIRSDGTLWHEVFRYEDRSDPNAEGWRGMLGAATPVHEGWETVAFHGAINFYTYEDDSDIDGTWREYVVLYDHGVLIRIDVVEEK